MTILDRRAFLGATAALGGGSALAPLFPAWARTGTPGLRAPMATLSGAEIALSIGHTMFETGGKTGHAVTVNGTLPAPVIRLKEGQTV